MEKIAYVLGTVDALDYVGYLDENRTTEKIVVLKDPLAVEYKNGTAEFTMGMLPNSLGIDLRSPTYVTISRDRIILVFEVDDGDPHPLVDEYKAARNRLVGKAETKEEAVKPDSSSFYRLEKTTYSIPTGEQSEEMAPKDIPDGTFYSEKTVTKTIPFEDAPKVVKDALTRSRRSRKAAPTVKR